MAGKSSKNPLLSGAGIGFPFENFPSSTLLVPVPQNEPPFIPEEIEADSFLGQEPQRSVPSSLKPLPTPSLVSSVNKSLSSVTPESSLTAESRTHFLSEPQLQAATSYSLIPEFTKSFTGGLHTAKPTPVYAGGLPQTNSVQPSTNSIFLGSAEVSKPPSQPLPPQPPSSLRFPSQAPTISNPVLAHVSFDSSPTQQTTYYQSVFPVAPSPVQTSIISNSLNQSAQSSKQIISNIPSSTVFTPSLVPVPLNDSVSNSLLQSPIFSSLSYVTPVSSSTSPVQPPLSSNWAAPDLSTPGKSTPFNSNQTFTNFSSPSVFTPAPSSDILSSSTGLPAQNPNFGHSNSSTPSVLSSVPLSSISPTQNFQSSASEVASTPLQPLFSYFSPSQTTTVTTPLPPSTTPTTLPPLTAAAPPVSGKTNNSYRLSNIKRPTYTRPPELEVTPMATMPSPVPPLPSITTPLTAPQPATLFTPDPTPVNVQRDTVDSESSPTLATATQSVTYRLPSQGSPPAEASVLPPSFASLAQGNTYRPVYHHWFYKKLVEGKVQWNPFSMQDSLNLEEAFTSATISPETKVATDGGRYDVEVLRRRRTAVYWQEESSEVRRCSWFVKGSMDVRYVPYEENTATMLEEEYRKSSTESKWNHQVQLPDGEVIIIHSPNAIAHHGRSVSFDEWGNSPMQQKPKVVKRGMDEFDINDGEPEKIDHLLFLVHGIGKFCDMKFRPVVEVVDDFRSISLQLIQSHFKEAMDVGQVGRIEVLPIPWHDALHSAHIDQKLNRITLSSIPRLRHFTNDTLLDILFYTSPIFCETIVQAVGSEMNRLYDIFLSRNPLFQGGVSLGGHSLGSLILFDMLCNQKNEPTSSEATPPPSAASPTITEEKPAEASGGEEVETLGCMNAQKSKLSRSVSYVSIGKAGTGQPFISYPQLRFKPKAFFALGSPIGMFVTVRGIESLGEDFALPTCPLFFNIFHPFDPVAYRVESLINADFSKYSPLLIPHHKGRKRMHLELKDTLEHVGAALKQRLMESVRSTWNTVCQSMFTRVDDSAIEYEMNKVIENEIMQSQSCSNEASSNQDNSLGPDVKMGQLNGGRRVDYVLQEAPFESFNEYVFALTSHVCYWESEDTMLMMLKEMYGTIGVSPDSQVVQQILPFELPEGLTNHPQYVRLPSASSEGFGMDPTAPMSDNVHVGPPPITGFFRQ